MPATLTTLIGWRRCSPRTTRAVSRSIPVVISSGVHPGRDFVGRAQVLQNWVVEGRLYMEPVEVDGGDIDVAVQELYKPPS
jgi:hypothetical protein